MSLFVVLSKHQVKKIILTLSINLKEQYHIFLLKTCFLQ